MTHVIKPFKDPIYVTQPFLPPLEDYCKGLEGIWKAKRLTNKGPLLEELTSQLSDYLDVVNVSLFANGTLALQLGLQALRVSGEVITTPFSFVATTHALYWNKIRPVFCDIEPDYYTLDPEKVEAAITPWTTAILAVHVFGHPCNLDALADIARRHNLLLIYDSAHAFGVKVNGNSIAKFGDMNMFSFHATKLFHSSEGGMLSFQESAPLSDVDYLKNFGFKNQVEVVMPGTNAKMNEIQALMGIEMLKHVPQIISARRKITEAYRARLEDIPGITMPPELPEGTEANYAYLPIEVDEEVFGVSRDALYEGLKNYNVFSRRYFYPLICDFACYQHVPLVDPLVTARKVAAQILTLPIYADLSVDSANKICDLIEQINK